MSKDKTTIKAIDTSKQIEDGLKSIEASLAEFESHMETEFNKIHTRLDNMIVKREEQNEEVRQSLKVILKNLER